jgi:hypothetical protein
MRCSAPLRAALRRTSCGGAAVRWAREFQRLGHRAHPRTAQRCRDPRFVLWTWRGARRSSVSTHRRVAALTAFSPRSPRLYATLCARAAPTSTAARQRTARTAHGGTAWHGAQASAAKRAHLGRSLVSSSARIRAAAASRPLDELAPRARAGGAGRIARLQVPDDRALSTHVALRRAGSLLHATAQDCGDVVSWWRPTTA